MYKTYKLNLKTKKPYGEKSCSRFGLPSSQGCSPLPKAFSPPSFFHSSLSLRWLLFTKTKTLVRCNARSSNPIHQRKKGEEGSRFLLLFSQSFSSSCSLSTMATCSLLLLRWLALFLVFSNLCPCFLSAVNITHLPGFNGALPFRLETGYVTMNEESGAELFYYFVESERNPHEDPLLLWLIGGPGCSAFNGLALDMGPLRFKVEDLDGNLPTLVANPYAWTKIANMIFLDWPAGTGNLSLRLKRLGYTL